MTVDYQIIQTRPLAPDQVLGYVHAGVPARLAGARRAYRCGSGRARTSVGHQNHGPRILMMHGTTNERTINVSSSRPMHTVEPT